MLGVTTTTRSTFSTSAVSPCSSSSGRLAFRPRASSTSSKDVKRLGGNHSRWRCAQSSISISSISASSSSFGRGGGKRNVGVSVLQNEGEVNELIEKILEDVKGTNAGATVQVAKREVIDGNINRLIELSRKQTSGLENQAIFNVYSVAYSSPGPLQKGAPAGGRFRGRLGQMLFRTTGLYQAIARPNQVKNLVTFNCFGIVPGSVGLIGTFVKVSSKTVKVLFERPRFTFLGMTFAFGPRSSVELETPAFYAQKIRIGRGSLGSLFVFSAVPSSRLEKVREEMDRVPKKRAWLFLGLFFSILGCFLYFLQRKFGSSVLLVSCALALLLGSVLRGGGIEDEYAEPEGASN